MSRYKVIQDIEAEDKLIGPLSFRQFVYGLVAALFLYVCFICLTKGATFLLIIFLPPALVSGFFAFPFGQDQPTEIWALAKIRFLFKPRRRIWDQSGVKELVTVTAPKKVEEVRTDGLTQTEVRSRLSALANTIDSRGWAVKNVNLNLSAQPVPIQTQGSDRLIDVSGLPQEVPTTDIQASDDILDERSNPIAHQFDEMITASTQAHRQQLMQMMQHQTPAPAPVSAAAATGSTPADYWFLSQPVPPPNPAPNQAMFTSSAVLPGVGTGQPGVVQAADPTAEEEALAAHIKEEHAKPTAAYAHLKTIQPLGMQPAGPAPQAQDTTQAPPKPPVTPTRSPAILELANNNDLNVATLARQAHQKPELPDEGEVVIALH